MEEPHLSLEPWKNLILNLVFFSLYQIHFLFFFMQWSDQIIQRTTSANVVSYFVPQCNTLAWAKVAIFNKLNTWKQLEVSPKIFAYKQPIKCTSQNPSQVTLSATTCLWFDLMCFKHRTQKIQIISLKKMKVHKPLHGWGSPSFVMHPLIQDLCIIYYCHTQTHNRHLYFRHMPKAGM